MKKKYNVPARMFKQHIAEVRQLMQGMVLEINVPKYKISIVAKIGLGRDRVPTINSYCIIPLHASREVLLSYLVRKEDEGDSHSFEFVYETIRSTPEFQQFSQRTKKICAEADEWDEKCENFLWVWDVFDPIENGEL